jgi:hypothetical protein
LFTKDHTIFYETNYIVEEDFMRRMKKTLNLYSFQICENDVMVSNIWRAHGKKNDLSTCGTLFRDAQSRFIQSFYFQYWS